MSELASEHLGASIISASSNDIKFPASNVIDGQNGTFWLTTGSFPQEIVIQLGEASTIKSIDILSTGLRSIEASKSDGPQANSWDVFCQTESSDADSEIQKISLQIPPRLTASFIRFKVVLYFLFCLVILV
jgi:hypothetical protein